MIYIISLILVICILFFILVFKLYKKEKNAINAILIEFKHLKKERFLETKNVLFEEIIKLQEHIKNVENNIYSEVNEEIKKVMICENQANNLLLKMRRDSINIISNKIFILENELKKISYNEY